MKVSRRGLRRWALALLAAALGTAYVLARRPPPPYVETRFLMDTLVSLTLWGLPEQGSQAAASAAFHALQAVDREMARIDGTPLRALNRRGGGAVPRAMGEVIAASLRWARASGGSFDPTIAPLLDVWDIGAGPHPPPSKSALATALAETGWERIRWDPASRTVDLGGTRLDFGGIAKGYAIDRAVAALRSRGVRDFLLNAGGDLYVAGSKGGQPWRVGIQHPRQLGALLRVVAPREGALVTSGDYERGYVWQGRRIHHILDPRTGEPASGCQSVTVWAPAAVDADALATAVFVLGPDKGRALLQSFPGAEALVVDAQGHVSETQGFGRVAPARGQP